MRAATAWIRGDEHAPDWVPDLTIQLARDRPCCKAREGRKGFICTRLLGHTGRHAAGDGERIVAVWP
jgi:hypothetical protein